MSYDKFTTITSPAVPLEIENVDTDQIIPARFLKAVERKGFGDNLFRDWRYNKDGSPKLISPLTTKNIQEKFWLVQRILEVVQVANTPRGQFTITVSELWFPASLPIFLRATH